MSKMSKIFQMFMGHLNEKVEIEENDLISEEELDSFHESSEYRDLDKHGRQPLHIASILGRLDVVAALLKQGVDINCKDDQGCTALHHSAAIGLLDVLKLETTVKNALINQNCGLTELTWAPMNGHKEIVEYLCSKKADINIKDIWDMKPLDWARIYERTEMVEILEKYANKS